MHVFRNVPLPIAVLLGMLLVITFPISVKANHNDSLIFSEYIEGSGYNKALEIYNPTDEEVDLSDYSVVHFNNGASQNPDDGKYVNAIPLKGTLDSGEIYVLVHSEADEDLIKIADQTDDSLFFNGDDAVVLFKNYNVSTRHGSVIDSIGEVGEDPGASWNQDHVSTRNATLIRKQAITAGDRNLYDSFDPSEQWIALPQDTFNYLGTHDPIQLREFHATVEKIIDGDTIRLKENVLGTDTVRLVHIDTPETYHLDSYDLDLVDTNPDHSQKYYGEKAEDFLQSLLQPGDEIILKVGAEPTDHYGRLLAQVIREDGGLNTNITLVRYGFAVTYFIHPIDSEETFHTFQDALDEAYDEDRGIWNDSLPLHELPFEFRARESGDDLTKFVGNYSTKKYVRPDDWKDVPVDRRIFFWTEEDALKAGYTPAFQHDSTIKNARSAKPGTRVTVTGVVTGMIELEDDTRYFIEDHAAGIAVDTDDIDANIGDEIQVKGYVRDREGLLIVDAYDADITDHDSVEVKPAEIDSSQIGEKTESRLVQLEDVHVWYRAGDDFNARDDEGIFMIFSPDHLVEKGESYDQITGIVIYDDGRYKVMPRFGQDVVKDKDDDDRSDLEEDLFEEYLEGEESLEEVAERIVELYKELDQDELADLLEEQLSEFIHTNGNTKQHIQSTVHHIMKSLWKMDRGKADKEFEKIVRELEKLIKKHEKYVWKGKGKGWNKKKGWDKKKDWTIHYPWKCDDK
ncbi:MAG: thermonuclease family protein [Bacillaceae bacterium]|nr:thermonuclease family protein [Bacillaceae bacterium]